MRAVGRQQRERRCKLHSVWYPLYDKKAAEGALSPLRGDRDVFVFFAVLSAPPPSGETETRVTRPAPPPPAQYMPEGHLA